ncbi:MAG TPA: hypothetical protein VF763_02260 [Candidatus Limnocylindrales bacterium]
MQHSTAARLTARPPARFVRPSGRDRERRLGLRRGLSFQPAAPRLTVLRGGERAPSVSLGGGWTGAVTAHPERPAGGLPRPSVTMHWAHSGGPLTGRRASAAAAPWRA